MNNRKRVTTNVSKSVNGQRPTAEPSKEFITKLARDYPRFKFHAGKQDHWSPRLKTIIYNPDRSLLELKYSVLHELAHGLLDHHNYTSDFELLRLEAEAWQMAAKIGQKYAVFISDEHIQNCLDTYRDWLHKRSTCPACGVHVLQKSTKIYHCFNCGAEWSVSSNRFMRPYRKATKN